jgi:hypothetical protein
LGRCSDADLPEKDDRLFLLFIALMPSNKASILGEGLPVTPHVRRSTRRVSPQRASRLRADVSAIEEALLNTSVNLYDSAKEAQSTSPHGSKLTETKYHGKMAWC